MIGNNSDIIVDLSPKLADITKNRKSLLEFMPESYKLLLSENAPKGIKNYQPSSIALAAHLLDEMIVELSKGWEISKDELFDELKIFESLGISKDIYAVNSLELQKGFFKYKGTLADIKYIINAVGYELDIYDYSALLRLKELPTGYFRDKENPDLLYFKNQYGKVERVKNCELYPILTADLSSPIFMGFDTSILEYIRQLILNRLLVCVYISRISTNFRAKDHYDKMIEYFTKVSLKRVCRDDYLSGLLWDRRNQWDENLIWDGKRFIFDYINIHSDRAFFESVFEFIKWDDKRSWDKEFKWDSSKNPIDDFILFSFDKNARLRDYYSNSIKGVFSSDSLHKIFDIYNPESLYWDNKEKWDKTIRKVYGNKWDLSQGKKEKDIIKITYGNELTDKVETETTEKIISLNKHKNLDVYNPVNILWDSKAKYDTFMSGVFGANKWDRAKGLYEKDFIFKMSREGVFTDELNVLETISDMFVSVKKDKYDNIIIETKNHSVIDIYNPDSVYWNNKEKWDNTLKKAYGNRWDRAKGKKEKDIFKTSSEKVFTDGINIEEIAKDMFFAVKKDRNGKILD